MPSRSRRTQAREENFIACVPRELPAAAQVEAAGTAIALNPANAPPFEGLARAVAAGMVAFTAPAGFAHGHPTPGHLALLTSRYWGKEGVKLPVAFMEPVAAELRNRILSHMNAWSFYANVSFTWTSSPANARVRITLNQDGYWSYIGTDVLHIPTSQPTMCLQDFTLNTSESEYRRVVRHETGHTLGFVHEQQLPEIVSRLDPQKTIAWGKVKLGWDEATIRSQILTPIDPSTVTATPHADVRGIMCYQLPASITRDGQPIPGGADIDDVDGAFAAKLYPKADVPTGRATTLVVTQPGVYVLQP